MSLTLAQVTVIFLDLYQQSKSTQKSYLSTLIPLLEDYGSTPIDELIPQDLEHYLESLQNLAPSTYRRHRTIITTLFNYAVKQGHILYNPLTHIASSVPLPILQSNIRYLTSEQLEILYQVLEAQKTSDGYRLYAIVKLLHCTGAKVAEILALNLDDIDFEQRQFQVTNPRQKTRRCSYSHYVDTLLNQYIRNYRHPSCAALFTAENYFTGAISRLSYSTLYQNWQKSTESHLILQSCRLNDLRHTFAIERVELLPVEVLCELMGHEDIKTTMQYRKFLNTNTNFIYKNIFLLDK